MLSLAKERAGICLSRVGPLEPHDQVCPCVTLSSRPGLGGETRHPGLLFPPESFSEEIISLKYFHSS